MKNYSYPLSSFRKFFFGLLCISSLLLTEHSLNAQSTYTFNYTGGQQTLALLGGTYDIKMWGANGCSSGNSRAGIGGYSNGTLTLPSSTTLYIVVGQSPLYTGVTGLQPGGYNGGGSGYANASGRAGGGATHIATLTGVLSSLSTSTAAVIMVAGGGGGDQNAGTIGHGGGLSGGGTYPGTQTGSAGGVFGAFGQGGNITTSYGGGGGGGWYGGGGNQNNAGSGGSGYIGGVTNAITTMSGQIGYVPNPDISGNGRVVITELCNFTLLGSTSNSINPSICAGQSLTLTTNAISNYSWSTGATSSSLVVSPTSSTVYALTATSPSNCTTTRNISVTVSSGQPTISVLSSTNQVCNGQSVTLTASGALTYTWANAGVVNGQSFTPVSTAVYTVTGQNGCGIASATTAVTVAPIQITVSATSTLVCSGKPTTLTAVSPVSNYTWYPNNISGNTAIVAPTSNIVYTVFGTDGICNGTQTFVVNTKPNPTVSIISSGSVICAGETVTMSASGATTYTWMPGNLNNTVITVSPLTTTLYVLTGENTVACTTSQQQVVIVDSAPNLNITVNPGLVCAGETATLIASGADNYVWTGGPLTAVFIPTLTATSVFTVTGSHSTNSCTAQQTVIVAAIVPSLSLPSNTSVCVGKLLTVYASGANDYSWNSISTGSVGVFSTQPSQNLTVTLVATTSSMSVNCPVTHTFAIVLNPLPTLSITANRNIICKNESNTLTVSGALSYTWTGGNTTNTLLITPSSGQVFTVSGTDANTCNNTVSYQAIVNACSGLNETLNGNKNVRVYPNPNDGSFIMESEGALELIIHNALGQILGTIHLGTDNNFKYQVRNLAPGIYFLSENNDAAKNVLRILVH